MKQKPKLVKPTPPARLVTGTQEVKMDQALERFVKNLVWDIERHQTDLTQWQKRFSEQPADALEWSSGIFVQAARLDVARHVLRAIKDLQANNDEYTKPSSEAILTRIKNILKEEVLRGARYPQNSTSVPSNEIHRQKTAAYAELLNNIEQLIEYSIIL